MRLFVPALLMLSLHGSLCLAQAKPSAEDLLKDADRARGGTKDGVTWDIEVEEISADGESNKVSYLVKVLDNDALAEAQAPARNKGEMMLFNDRNLWFFKPGLKKPVSISPRQKLMGQAANGDIASTQYYRDYDGQVVGEEMIGGVATWKLDLKAKAKNVTYDRITYWIAKDKRVGIKSDFLTVSGELFKTATFEYANTLKDKDGKSYPFVSKMFIIDALNKANKTNLVYSSPKLEAHAASLFNVNNLVR